MSVGLCRPKEKRAFWLRRAAGTTLIELLVVIVVFLVGILAVIQIFPKGFQILITTRNNAAAGFLARDQIEWLKAHPDQLPQEIVPVIYFSGTAIVDPNHDPNELNPPLNSSDYYVDGNGTLFTQNSAAGYWMLLSGPNAARRVIGEGSRVPAPRNVGAQYGGLRLVNFSPIDPTAPLTAYANDLTKLSGVPRNLAFIGNQNVSIGGSPVNAGLYDSTDTLSPYEYFVGQPDTPGGFLLLPTSSQFSRVYHLRVSAFIGNATGYGRLDYTDLSITVPATTLKDPAGNTPPLIQVALSDVFKFTPGALGPGQGLGSVEYDTVQVAPQYNVIPVGNSFSGDPFEFKVLDGRLGTLLFSPAGYATTIERPGGAREPLEARVNYDVYDWRIIRQEFRLDNQQNLNGGSYGQFRLALQSIKVGNQSGPDGLPQGGIAPFEATNAPAFPSQAASADNCVIADVQTGGIVSEVNPSNGAQIVDINKSTGILSFTNADPIKSGLNGFIYIPGTPNPIEVDLTGRALRVMYRARNEFAVQVMKAAASYSIVTSGNLSVGQCFAPSPLGTRLYFPKSDLHAKVTIGGIWWRWNDGSLHSAEGQDFNVEYPVVPDGVGLPCIDVKQIDSAAVSLASDYGAVARDIKGASVSVRVLWNPAFFRMSTDVAANTSAIDKWTRNWRRSTVQSYLQSEEIR